MSETKPAERDTMVKEQPERQPEEQPEEQGVFDTPFKPQESSGLTSLQSAYNSREVSLPMLVVGAVLIAALAGVLVALVLFNR